MASILFILHYIIGFGIFSDPKSSEFEGETLDYSFILQFAINLVLVTLVFYLILLKYRRIGMRVLYSSVFIMILVLFGYELISEVLIQHSGYAQFIILTLSAIFLVFLTLSFIIYSSGQARLQIRNFGILTLSAITARMISLSIDLTTFIAIAFILSVYDIWNVFRGPLSKLLGQPKRIQQSFISYEITDEMIESICIQGAPVVIQAQINIITGMGDYLFYSALFYTSFLYWSIQGIILIFITVNLGIFITYRLLSIISPLPGLPIPILLSLLGFASLFLFA